MIFNSCWTIGALGEIRKSAWAPARPRLSPRCSSFMDDVVYSFAQGLIDPRLPAVSRRFEMFYYLGAEAQRHKLLRRGLVRASALSDRDGEIWKNLREGSCPGNIGLRQLRIVADVAQMMFAIHGPAICFRRNASRDDCLDRWRLGRTCLGRMPSPERGPRSLLLASSTTRRSIPRWR
jgi:hypothetical protein